MRKVQDYFQINIRVYDETGFNPEWVGTDPQPAFGDSHGSVAVIHFMDDAALFFNGKHVGTAFEEHGTAAYLTLLNIGRNLADSQGSDFFELEIDPKDYDGDDFDEWLLDGGYADLGLIAFHGLHPLDNQ